MYLYAFNCLFSYYIFTIIRVLLILHVHTLVNISVTYSKTSIPKTVVYYTHYTVLYMYVHIPVWKILVMISFPSGYIAQSKCSHYAYKADLTLVEFVEFCCIRLCLPQPLYSVPVGTLCPLAPGVLYQ